MQIFTITCSRCNLDYRLLIFTVVFRSSSPTSTTRFTRMLLDTCIMDARHLLDQLIATVQCWHSCLCRTLCMPTLVCLLLANSTSPLLRQILLFTHRCVDRVYHLCEWRGDDQMPEVIQSIQNGIMYLLAVQPVHCNHIVAWQC